MEKRDSLEYYFANTGFYDFLPLALDLISTMGFSREEAIEAVCKVFDKARVYPPTKNGRPGFWLCLKKN